MKLLLAEDSALLRAGLEQLLAALGHSVTTANDAEELLACADSGDFDLIITDVRMPPTMSDDGLRAVHDVRAADPSQPVVVLSQYVAASYLDRLLEHGGFGYLLKERVSDVDEFVHTLEEVAGGGTVVDPEVVTALLSARRTGLSQLTAREREVLGLMAQGLSNKEIEDKLVLTAGAVSKHVSNVFIKLGFRPPAASRPYSRGCATPSAERGACLCALRGVNHRSAPQGVLIWEVLAVVLHRTDAMLNGSDDLIDGVVVAFGIYKDDWAADSADGVLQEGGIARVCGIARKRRYGVGLGALLLRLRIIECGIGGAVILKDHGNPVLFSATEVLVRVFQLEFDRAAREIRLDEKTDCHKGILLVSRKKGGGNLSKVTATLPALQCEEKEL